jgi:hypothetical protein
MSDHEEQHGHQTSWAEIMLDRRKKEWGWQEHALYLYWSVVFRVQRRFWKMKAWITDEPCWTANEGDDWRNNPLLLVTYRTRRACCMVDLEDEDWNCGEVLPCPRHGGQA